MVTDSYWDTETNGQGASAGGTGKTTAERVPALPLAGCRQGQTPSGERDHTYRHGGFIYGCSGPIL